VRKLVTNGYIDLRLPGNLCKRLSRQDLGRLDGDRRHASAWSEPGNHHGWGLAGGLNLYVGRADDECLREG
jgi:hypothetical protein